MTASYIDYIIRHNMKDFEELPEKIRTEVEFVFAKDIPLSYLKAAIP